MKKLFVALVLFSFFTGANLMAQTATETTAVSAQPNKLKMQGVKRSEVRNKINADLKNNPSKRKVLMTKKIKVANHTAKETAAGTHPRNGSVGAIGAGSANAKLKMRNAKLQKATNVQSE